MTDDFESLRRAIHSTSPITAADWKLFKPGLQYKRLRKGDYFVEEGKTYRYIGFVLRGALRAYHLVEGEEVNCNFYFEGQWPKAYHSFLTSRPSRIWIRAMEDCDLFLVPYDHLQNMFKKSKSWERFGRIASENAFVAAQERSDMLLLDKPGLRYHHLCMRQPELLERVPLYHIASYIGVKQPSLSRIRRRSAGK